jgi:CubicO group peptidase (beta-lactamase class C family)
LGDVTDRPFADVLDALVLRPAGMEHSTFAQPLPAALAGRAAAGHRPDGTPLPGRWHTYPEQAAAGLWTTASDLARLAVTVQQAFVGLSGPVLAPATARQMLTLQPPADSYGLGFGVGGEGGSRFFTHPGGNAGYVANLVVFAETGQGAVVLANREGAVELTHEILRAVARTYGWPATGWNALQPTERVAVTPSPASLRPLAGRYRLGEEAGGPVVIVTAGADGLSARMPDWPAARALYAAGPRRFFFLDNPLELTFEADAGGGAPAAALSAGGPPVRAARVE